VLIPSQHVEQLYARELLAQGASGIGYLLKESVFKADQFVDALERVAAGSTTIDPAVITQLMSSSHRPTSLFGKLGITDDDTSNRRVVAVLTYLGLTDS
jgi:DNA-binding NarL/FixJ family response regulator